MIPRALLFVSLALVAGCGSSNARLKGELTENGRPVSFPPEAMASVVFRPLDSQGRPSEALAFKAVVSPAGAFEWVGGNGELPAGGYQFSLELSKSAAAKYKHLAPENSRRRVDLTPGANVLTLDITPP